VFVTPSLSAFAFARLQPSGPAWRQIAVAQLRGTARRSTVSIAAVLVSFSLMVAMAIMVYSFRLSLEDWMQRILPADLYVRAGLANQSAYLDHDAQEAVRSLPGWRADFMRRQEVNLPPAVSLCAGGAAAGEKSACSCCVAARDIGTRIGRDRTGLDLGGDGGPAGLTSAEVQPPARWPYRAGQRPRHLA
jgi:hypothetical protein